ncbi:hypothetical protein FRB99_002915 [Tulasnella sp. 403]|nr:hypothetical protein FRB99_002915 [Tulasnella sp. 403]
MDVQINDSPPASLPMVVTTRSSPTSASARLASAQAKAKRKSAAELAYTESAISRERTKRGCWTCRIRRKSVLNLNPPPDASTRD